MYNGSTSSVELLEELAIACIDSRCSSSVAGAAHNFAVMLFLLLLLLSHSLCNSLHSLSAILNCAIAVPNGLALLHFYFYSGWRRFFHLLRIGGHEKTMSTLRLPPPLQLAQALKASRSLRRNQQGQHGNGNKNGRKKRGDVSVKRQAA